MKTNQASRAPIPVAFITDGNFVMQTATAIRSLLDSRAPGTEYDVRVVTADCPEETRACFAAFPAVRVVEASLEEYRDIRQMAHIPIACLLKFNLCELLADCDRLLYLDGDVLVRDDLTALYESDLGGHLLGATPQTVLVGTGEKKISAGILLFDAERMRREHVRERLVETRRALGDQRSMDQQSFNLLLGGDMVYLPLRYNFCPAQVETAIEERGMDALNEYHGSAYTDFAAALSDAAIVHFATGTKPWIYRNIPYADAWYESYRKTPFGDELLHRRRYTVWQSRWYGVKRALGEGGLPGLLRFLGRFVRRKVFHRYDTNDWG